MKHIYFLTDSDRYEEAAIEHFLKNNKQFFVFALSFDNSVSIVESETIKTITEESLIVGVVDKNTAEELNKRLSNK